MRKTLLLIPLGILAISCGSDQKNYRYVEGRRNAETPEMVFDTIDFQAENDTLAFIEMYKMYIKSVQEHRDEPIKPFLYNLLDERDSIPFSDFGSIGVKMQLQERALQEMKK